MAVDSEWLQCAMQRRCQEALRGLPAGSLLLGLPFGYPGWRWEMLCLWAILAALGVLVQTGSTWRHSFQGNGVPIAGLLFWVVMGYGYGSWHTTRALAARIPDCADVRSRSFQFDVLEEPSTPDLPHW